MAEPRSHLLLLLMPLFCCLSTATAWAAVLYGVESDVATTENVFILHRDDGQADLVGDAGFSKLSGLSYDATTGLLYASTGNQSNAPRSLLIVDQQTGQSVLVGDIDTATTSFGAFSDLAVDPAGQIYGVTGRDCELLSIDKQTGDGTVLGSIAVTSGDPTGAVQGLAFDSYGDLYGSTKLGQLILIDIEYPAASLLIAEDPGAMEINAIVFDADDTLYGVGGSELYLFEVSGSVLVSTLIGFTGQAIRGLAFAPVPGDFDDDCDVDLDDLAEFVSNLAGPGIAPLDTRADLDRDGDCDMRDYSLFTQCFTGEGLGCP